MVRQFDFGVVAYGQPEKLHRCLSMLRAHSTTSFRCRVVVNPHPDIGRQQATLDVARRHEEETYGQVSFLCPKYNLGYAGGVNEILKWAQTKYIGYMDHDAYVDTLGWDEMLCSILDRFHEVGMVFPNGGAAQINRGEYVEILWGVGCCWALRRLAYSDVGLFDMEIGHQEEVDYQTRVRLAGYTIAALPPVRVSHDGTASGDPVSTERINKGVRNWVTKWVRYFGGKNLDYHSLNVLRHEDWPPSALYMEKYFKLHLGEDFNSNPDTRVINGVEYDLIKVPRLKGFYRNRII